MHLLPFLGRKPGNSGESSSALDRPRAADAAQSALDDAQTVEDPSVKEVDNPVIGSRSPTPTVDEGGPNDPPSDNADEDVVQAASDADEIVETVASREKRRAKPSKRSRKSDANTDSDSDGPAARSRKKGAKGVPYVVYDSDDSDNRPSSRPFTQCTRDRSSVTSVAVSRLSSSCVMALHLKR